MNATEVIQNFGGIGEFIGAIGVVATLVYLGIQVNQTRKSNERDAAIELIRSFQTADFTRMLQKSFDIPFGLTRKEFESKYPDAADAPGQSEILHAQICRLSGVRLILAFRRAGKYGG